MTPTPENFFATETPHQRDGNEIVISGMSGLYPESRNIMELSDILYNKINPVSDKKMRFKYNHPEVVQKSGVVPELEYFDSQFFKVSYRLALFMEPMSRKLLEHTYQAIYDAGVNPTYLNGQRVGVYIGSCFSETEKAGLMEASSRYGLDLSGSSKTMFANRISYWLNTKGPSMAIDEACCSSTAALEQAYRDMSRGECEAAIVGASFLSLHPQNFVHCSRIMKMSPDGKIKSFDENADGCAKSEAINVLFLQKAKDALRIYAQLLHVKSEFTCVPDKEPGPSYGFDRNLNCTISFIKQFYEGAGVSPQAVEYVEAFGSAIPEIDKVELQAIEAVYCNNRDKPLLVGSVTSNIGYVEAASGIAAVTKVLLAYHNGKIASNLHCERPRTDIAAMKDGRMRVVTEHQVFNRTYTAINGMSYTGLNSHVLMGGLYKPKDINRYKSNIPYLVTISARHEKAVQYMLDQLKSNPIDHEQLALLHNLHRTNISGNLGNGYIVLAIRSQTEPAPLQRSWYEKGLGYREEMRTLAQRRITHRTKQSNANEDQKTVSLVEKVEFFDDTKRPLWFVYSGMGSQWVGMGTELMRIPTFAAAIERCHKALEPVGIDITKIITASEKSMFDNILHSFVGIAAIQIGLTDILHELGLKPDGIIGHSVGELGCAYADGCLTAEEMILAAYYRGLVSIQTPFIHGSMAAIGMGFKQISPLCPPEIEVACHNGPGSSTISGPSDVMREFVSKLTAQGIFAKEVPCSNIAYHSRYIVDAGPGLLKYLKEAIRTPKERSKRWLSSSVPEDKWNDPIAKFCSAEYLTNNLLNPVLFEETSRLIPSNAVLVEIAPHGLLQAILTRSLPSCKNIALARRKHPNNILLLLQAIGELYMQGFYPNVQVLYPKVEMPVSTGTPFLSHLVKWEHSEKWPLALHVSANRKTSSSCHFVVSLHDKENSYLRGNVVRGHTLYPFAATLCLVWDTLAMTIGAQRKQISVRFHDVYLYSQPILHDRRQLKLHVELQRGSGKFEVSAEKSKVMTGFIYNVDNFDKKYDVRHKPGSLYLNEEQVYQLFYNRDYIYSDEFRSIENINESLSEASLKWADNWSTMIDGMLQLNVLQQPHDGISKITHISRITIDIKKHNSCIQQQSAESGHLLLPAKIFSEINTTGCGGIVIQDIKFKNLQQRKSTEWTMDTFKFVSNDELLLEDKESMLNKNSTGMYKRMILQYANTRDNATLKCMEAANLHGNNVVLVHYAGITNVHLKKYNGSLKKCAYVDYGADFSGITERGERVMGIVPSLTVSSQVLAQPELLWPVPEHWSLEDAATVPLAYAQAFYCLAIKSQAEPGMTILVHGGTGALGQALINISLAIGCEVFTTVSDIRKKRFLQKLFPELKATNISCSRDHTFKDVILTATEQRGCNIIVSGVTGDLKDSSLKCLAPYGIFIDISQLNNDENYNFGMNNLNKETSYVIADFSSLFAPENMNEIKAIHAMLSHGVARGYVRPLTRVSYNPCEAKRAFHLLRTGQHLGRVLLNLQDKALQAQPSLNWDERRSHLVICGKDGSGLQLASRLVENGVKKLSVCVPKQELYQLQYNIRSWKRFAVEVTTFSDDRSNHHDIASFLNEFQGFEKLEGIYVITSEDNCNFYEKLISDLDTASRSLCSNLRYFAVLNIGENEIGKSVCRQRRLDQLPASLLVLPELKHNADIPSWRGAVDATENAMVHGHDVVVGHIKKSVKSSLLKQIAIIADIPVVDNPEKGMSLIELGVKPHKLPSICSFLETEYNLVFTEEQVSSLTINDILVLEGIVSELPYTDTKGLATFINHVDKDELLATTDIVFLPSLTYSGLMRDDEFDESSEYLYIVPGIEGHHDRFRVLCQRLKLGALVLQPGLDHPHENPRQTAERLAQVMLKKTRLNNKFLLLGYESGISVALEIAAILEEKGLTGTVFCLGFTPNEFQTVFEEELSHFKTTEQLEDGLLTHMYKLMTGTKTSVLENVLQSSDSWEQKIDLCMRALLGNISHSTQYARALLQCTLERIVRSRFYSGPAFKLRSKLVFIRAALSSASPSYSTLQQLSKEPVAVHQLDTPLVHVATDLRCATIIHEHLDPAILEAFLSRNICDTYLINPNSYMSKKAAENIVEGK